MSRKAMLIIMLVLGGAVLLGIFLFLRPSTAQAPADKLLARVPVGEEVIALEVFRTPAKRSRGLSGREHLGPNEGAIFLFESPSYPKFWMKGMKIPIDIIWLRDGIILGIEESIKPPEAGLKDADLERYTPPEAINAVIELPAGRSSELGLVIGQRLNILIP